jgi:hypothetical protein
MKLHRPILTVTLDQSYPSVWTLRLPDGQTRQVTDDRWRFASRPYPHRFHLPGPEVKVRRQPTE